jgi:3-oxoacyl-[acyl-carrier protein] reductase
MSDRPLSDAADKAVAALLDEVMTEPKVQPLLEVAHLSGQVAIITGGSSGIGRAVALEFVGCGMDIAFCYLAAGPESEEDAEGVARELRQKEVRVFYKHCDVRESVEVDSFVGEAHEELGGLHVLVNNAGIGSDRAMWRMEDSQWEAVLRTNLDGAFFFTRAVAPYLRAQEHGKVVNITSVHGIRSAFGISNYASSKAGLIGLTCSSAVELGPKNINVNAVAPGYIRTTRLTDGVSPELLDAARERSVLGRLGDPQDVAGVVLFLCSEAARHITGQVITVDGGYLL